MQKKTMQDLRFPASAFTEMAPIKIQGTSIPPGLLQPRLPQRRVAPGVDLRPGDAVHALHELK